MTTLRITITAWPSRSKGWGRWRILNIDGETAVTSNTGNEWLYADRSIDLPEGWRGRLKIQAQDLTASGRERLYVESCELTVADGESFSLETGGAQPIEVRVEGAR